MTSALFVLFACWGPAGSPHPIPDGTFPALDLRTGPSSDVRLLLQDLGRAELVLADTNLPEGAGTSVIEVDLATADRDRDLTRVPIPFALGDGLKTINDDLTVTIDGRPLTPGYLGIGRDSWGVERGSIVMRTEELGKTAVFTLAGADTLIRRQSLSRSGLSAVDFLQASMGIEGRTHSGLRLTSPSTVTWPVDVPPRDPRFTATLSLMRPVMKGLNSDGMLVHLEVVDPDGVHPVASWPLDAVAFTEPVADLSRWAGRSVALRIRTEPTGSSDHDVAFVGNPVVWGVPADPVRRVIVVGLDTTRPDHLSWYGYPKATTPELDAFANTAAVFTKAWTPAPRTRPSFRSATTGRYPLLAVGATNIGEVFQRNGFATVGFVANTHLQPRFDFDDGFDQWLFDGGANANVQVDRALDWFRSHSDRDTYMFLHFMDPHLGYNAPAPFTDRFVTATDPMISRGFSRWSVSRAITEKKLTEAGKEQIVALHDGELAFMSHELGRLFRELDGMEGQTLIVVHNDHGEEFFEHNGFEHNHTLYDEVTRAILMIRPPGGTSGGPVRVKQPATLADIAPTLYSMLGFSDRPATDGIDLLRFAQGADPETRDIGIAHLRYGLDRWAVVRDDHKYIVYTGNGHEELYDLEADPGEKVNLSTTVDLAPYRKALLAAHPELRGGVGWRIRVDGSARFTLPAPGARSAGILDPYADQHARPNLAWGEPHHRLPEQVGRVALEGEMLSYDPGSKPPGQIWVLFEGDPPPPPAGVAGARLTTTMLVIPPDDEATRMEALLQAKDEPASKEDICRLCELGYIEGESCDPC